MEDWVTIIGAVRIWVEKSGETGERWMVEETHNNPEKIIATLNNPYTRGDEQPRRRIQKRKEQDHKV